MAICLVVGLVAAVGLAAVHVGVNARINLVHEVAVVRTSSLLGTASTGSSMLAMADASTTITVGVDAENMLVKI